ncbi:unnamed protein product [Periconia digitata]|uniref:Uncharacterized protein n=1 Tax=Periconia digitata TaxID=1303443 RepID=A0A9W4XV06_9PLEO|nr:unnamed protein product [Periconia digitata]
MTEAVLYRVLYCTVFVAWTGRAMSAFCRSCRLLPARPPRLPATPPRRFTDAARLQTPLTSLLILNGFTAVCALDARQQYVSLNKTNAQHTPCGGWDTVCSTWADEMQLPANVRLRSGTPA